MQDDVGAVALFLRLFDRVTVRPVGLPAVRLLLAVRLRDDRHLVGHHECGVETNAELTDDVDVFILDVFLEVQAAALGDDAQVLVEILLGHADAVIADRQRAGVFIRRDADREVLACKTGDVLAHALVVELVDRIAGIADQLAQKDFLMRVDAVDHQIEQPF